eukprot:1187519-Prorocentrum_minimum.AAC.2
MAPLDTEHAFMMATCLQLSHAQLPPTPLLRVPPLIVVPTSARTEVLGVLAKVEAGGSGPPQLGHHPVAGGRRVLQQPLQRGLVHSVHGRD